MPAADTSFLTILPNLSIGVVSVLTLGYLSIKHAAAQKDSQEVYIKAIDDRADKHEKAMRSREDSLREVEMEIRGQLVKISEQSIAVIGENNRVMERVIHQLDTLPHTRG